MLFSGSRAGAQSALRRCCVITPCRTPLSTSVRCYAATTADRLQEQRTPVVTPSDRAQSLWHRANAVCFDVDCTVTSRHWADLLAQSQELGGSSALNQALDGSLDEEEACKQLRSMVSSNPTHLDDCIAANTAASRVVPGVAQLVSALQARGVAVYLLGGCREFTLPIAEYLGVPEHCVLARKLTDQPRVSEKDKMTVRKESKAACLAQIRQKHVYNTVVMIGDGVADLKAVQETGGADLFIGYGGVVEREAVAQQADWYVRDFSELQKTLKRFKVAVIGSGAWACAATHLIAHNTRSKGASDQFHEQVKMWVHEEDYEGDKLSEVINSRHENPKYLPGVSLGPNVLAVPDLEEAVRDADILVVCTPHQFARGICNQLAGKVKEGAFAISLIKGMRVRPEGPQLISAMVRQMLGLDCSVLMGANIASDIGREEMSEAVIGYHVLEHGQVLKRLFETDYFQITLTPDVVGAEMCGTLKNIVALAAGMVDGLGLGSNAKAAIIRRGLEEMRRFSRALYPTVRDDTFLETCGVGDLVASCYGGRNRLVAMEFTKAWKAGTPKTFEELEHELLGGQSLQGVLTSNEVQEILRVRGWESDYPLFTTTKRIVTGQEDPTFITQPHKVAAAAPSSADGVST